MLQAVKRIAVIGGGAAGCFCAVNVRRRLPDVAVTVFEAGPVPMVKLAVTGGGRCNLTNTFEHVDSLRDVYPRGFNLMKRALGVFSQKDAVAWFEAEGVEFYAMEDGCVFPVSDDARQITGTLERLMRELGVEMRCRKKVVGIDKSGGRFVITCGDGASAEADAVVVTSGGGTAALTESFGIETVPPVPSLFTFKAGDSGLHSLMGVTVEEVSLSIAGTKFKSRGTLLVTDWGFSGPAALRLSSYAARHLAERGYRGDIVVNWLDASEGEVRETLLSLAAENPARLLSNVHPEALSSRLWEYLMSRAGLREDIRCSELGSKGLARLASVLTSDVYAITDRCRFKEEFVTCGGVALTEVDPSTMESRKVPGLFFAGEVLDIDAVTGGFNLQAAWSTAFTVSKEIVIFV